MPIILGFRFLYGLRTVTPFVIGMSRVPIVEFVLLNVIGAAIWAIVIGVLGYVFGHGLELILGNLMHYEIEILSAVLLLGVLIWIIHITYVKRKYKQTRSRS
jgi:membrane protein DedA with SNARE-associated domain